MKIAFTFLLIFVLCGNIAICQIGLSGTIIDKTTKLPVGYANIGIFEKEIGTVADENGKFGLSIPEAEINNSITINHLGYKDTKIKITEFGDNTTSIKIELELLNIELREIKIEANREYSLGYKPNGEKVKGFFKAAGMGMEGGTLIKNKDTLKLEQFNFNILKTPFDSLKFRLNFYAVRQNKLTTKVNPNDIIFNISKTDEGEFSLLLENEKIYVSGDFVCTIELIDLFGQNPENAEFLFSAIPDKNGLIFKKAISMGKWDRIKEYSLCFWFKGVK